MRNRGSFLAVFLLSLLLTSSRTFAADSATAAESAAEESAEPQASFFATTTVTATGSEVDSFEVATPVTVLPATRLEERAADNAVVVLRDEPGVDVNGVGPNQARPVIRGQRGLRVLYLEDGLRMNNARRQTDFGEIPGLTDVDEIQSLEVVRGPASVLYGSDAIGGVLNLLTKSAPYRDGQRLGGSVGIKYSSAGDQQRAHGSFDGRFGDFSFRLGGSWREAESYDVPSGSFGKIRLEDDTEVLDSGVKDDSLSLFMGYSLGENQTLSLRHSRYGAKDSGFGLVDPTLLGDDSGTVIRILYPEQSFDRTVLRYLGSVLETALVDSVELQVYQQSNERELANLIDINIGPLFPGAPDSRVFADTLNTTDLDTTGLRAELVKVSDRHFFTYGAEAYRDEAVNTDRSETTTTLRFPFPPFTVTSVTRDTLANSPNATNLSYGAFAQDEIAFGDKLKVTLGARYQKVETEADATPGWNVDGLSFEDDALVGSLNVLYRVSDHLRLTGGYGTAFRAPNIIERLFNGPTPEGSGYQLLNPELQSEDSQNIDLGLKYQRANALLELTLFRNDIDDGVVQYFLSPAEVEALPAAVRAAIQASRARFVVQERNIEKLRYEGAELAIAYRSPLGFAVGGNYTYVDGERIDSTNPPTGDSFGDKVNVYVRYSPPSSRYWVEYRLRHNGQEKANLDPNEPLPPVGAQLPAFTVHSLSGGARLFELAGSQHSLGLVVDNLTDELYAEFSNVTFFRPQPGRNVTLSYRVGF